MNIVSSFYGGNRGEHHLTEHVQNITVSIQKSNLI
jgi:hypothetical protein